MASKLDDPNFGSRDDDPSRPKDASKLNDRSFGSKDPEPDPYKQTRDTLYSSREKRDEKQFQKRFERELKRGAVSRRTQAELASRAINGFVSSIIAQKKASLNAGNESKAQEQKNSSIVSIETSSLPRRSPEAKSKPKTSNPYGIYIVDICENGEAKKLQLVTYGGTYTE